MKRVAVVIMFLLSLFVAAPVANAESASSDVIVLVGTTIDLEISADNIIIDEIQPGMFVAGNEIIVSTWTNDEGGFNLYVSVGDGEIYKTSDLEHETSADSFSSLPTSGTYTTDTFPDNSWGVSVNSGQSYFGLPYTMDGEKVLDSSLVAGTSEINFLASAKAGNIATGKYENVLIFTAIPRTEVNQLGL